MKARARVCGGCPFSATRTGPPIPAEVMAEVDRRITGGEAWVCHQTCDGAQATTRSLLCAGAPPPG